MRRESEWTDDKKRVYQELKLAEEGRRTNQSAGRRMKSQYTVSPKKIGEHSQMSEVEKSIKMLKEQTEALKGRLLQMQVEGVSRERAGLVKTFWHADR